jgi:hypothetical protein
MSDDKTLYYVVDPAKGQVLTTGYQTEANAKWNNEELFLRLPSAAVKRGDAIPEDWFEPESKDDSSSFDM